MIEIGTVVQCEVDTFGILHDFQATVVGRNFFGARPEPVSYIVKVSRHPGEWIETTVQPDQLKAVQP